LIYIKINLNAIAKIVAKIMIPASPIVILIVSAILFLKSDSAKEL